MAAITQNLEHRWSFKQTDTCEWLPVCRVPTNVHLDLMDNNIIQDPFLGFNERDCQWVGDKSWTYKTSFDAPVLVASRERGRFVIVFEGLDTYATVTLNGHIILQSDNMFVQHRVDITDRFLSQQRNVLEIEFKSALKESTKIKDAYREHKWVGSNGDMARLAARKAQYHYGWDWGPVLTTCGPWRPIRLEVYTARIADVQIDYEVGANLNIVSGTITATAEGTGADSVEFSASFRGVESFKSTGKIDVNGCACIEFHVGSPKLWYPAGYGEQHLYIVAVRLLRDGHVVDSTTRRIGFRKAELVQRSDETGKSFYFRINSIDVFCGGSNWIPADSFTPRISKKRYHDLLTTMIEGNQNMLRVWGGGIWEDDAFYDTCDELGILVWQDFMFACGNYPAYTAFLESVKQEAVCQLKRLRHHPSLVVYAGNNEDYQIREQEGLAYDSSDKNPISWLATDFPARYIYEKLLPDIVSTYSPHTPYHPGSPFSEDKPTSDPALGDQHEWNVWHGTQEPYQRFGQLGGRFNSEFGMEAFPHRRTIEHFVTDRAQLRPNSEMIDFHNKAVGHASRLAKYTNENLRVPDQVDLDAAIYLTQLVQAEALAFAYKGWRKRWGEEGRRECGGALVWQLNDCWPVVSWSIVDYFGRRKAAYYAIKRALAPVAIAVQREFHGWRREDGRPPGRSRFECWVASRERHETRGSVELRFVGVATGRDIKKKLVKEDVAIIPNGTTCVFEDTVDNTIEEPHVLAATLRIDGQIVARDVDWPQPLKSLDLSERGVTVKQHAGSDQIVVNARKPTKGLVLEERDGIVLDDNLIDVIPGDPQVVRFRSATGVEPALGWTYLDAPKEEAMRR